MKLQMSDMSDCTNEDGFISRLYGMISFYEIYPIVFNLMERLKEIMRFRR